MLALFLAVLGIGILWALWLLPEGQVRPNYAAWMAVTAFCILSIRLAFRLDAWGAALAAAALSCRLRGGRGPLALASVVGAAVLYGAVPPALLPTAALSALVLGVTVDGMVLGHWYLVQHGLSFEPLKRMSVALLAVVGARLALAGCWVWQSGSLGMLLGPEHVVFFLLRTLLGFVGPLVLGWMVWECVKLKSNTSATGILYVITLFVLAGELTAAYFWTSMGARL